MEINEVVIFYFNLFFNQSKLAALSGVRFTKMRNSSNEMEAFFESIAIINNKQKRPRPFFVVWTELFIF